VVRVALCHAEGTLRREQRVRLLGAGKGELLWGGCAVAVGRASRGWGRWRCWDSAPVRLVVEGGVCLGAVC